MNFDDLVLQSESLVKNLDEDSLPHVHKSIEHLRQQKDRFICPRIAQSDIKAARLLGNNVGNELSSKLSKTLETLETNVVPDKSATVSTDDIPSFLKQQRENAILLAFQLAKDCSNKESFKEISNAKKNWWNSEKNKICNIMLNADKLPHLVHNNQRSIKSNPVDTNRYVLHNFAREEIKYIEDTCQYVDQIINSNTFIEPIESKLLTFMKFSKNSDLREIFDLTLNYCKVGSMFDSDKLLTNRQYDSEMTYELIVTSINHLESEFLSYIKQCISNSYNVKDECGTLRSSVGVFVQSILLKDEFVDFDDGRVDGIPVWPYVYTAFRAGLYNVALEILKDASGYVVEMHNLLSQYIQNGFVSSDLKKITGEYKRAIRMTNDVCKKLMYCLLTGCDVDDNHTQILTSIDDFIWARLWHARRVNSIQRTNCGLTLQAGDTSSIQEISMNNLSTTTRQNRLSDIGSLKHLQKLILEDYGESYFQASDNSIAYARILLLCQLYENAVAFLARFGSTICHGVYLGIVLWTKSVLLVSSDIRNPILTRVEIDATSSYLVRVNLAKLCSIYASKFERNYPEEAVDLFFLLRDMQTPSIQQNSSLNLTFDHSINDPNTLMCVNEGGQLQAVESVFVRLVSELAVSASSNTSSSIEECDDESLHMLQILFGRTGISGGLLQRRGLESEINSLLKGVAARLVNLGRIEAASEALELSGQINEAANILSRALSTMSVSTTHNTSTTHRLYRLQTRAHSLLNIYRNEFPASMHLLERVLAASTLLLMLESDLSELSWQQNDPIKLLDQTELLPSSPDNVLAHTQQFRDSHALLKALLAPLLLCASKILREMAQMCMKTNNSLLLNDIRNRAAALVVYTGQLPYRMPAEVYSCLSQLEISIN